MMEKGKMINDRYQIVRLIGEGGMANVYLAYDIILKRNVAVKVLRGDLATDEKFVRCFQREAISASALSHPNIVEMYDVGEDDGVYFIVMEYIDGKTLKSLIKKRGFLSVTEVVDIMLQLASAISCAHDSYIIHRDIKPQNVLILNYDKVKITDFGIAIASNASELTQTNSIMGSVHYLPPELANGKMATAKSDIYSLGILMYELLTGKVPFKGENAVEIALKQMKEKLPSVRKQNPDIPQSVENILLKACAKNPKNRYESARDMYDDLKTCLDEDRENEPVYSYAYPETDLDDTIKLEGLEKIKLEEEKKEKKDKKKKKEESKEEKKFNLALIIMGGVAAFLALFVVFALVIFPMFGNKTIVIPETEGLTVEKAEKKLMDAGIKVAKKTNEDTSEDIEKGLVINTSPAGKRKIKAKDEVTLIISKGSAKITIKDYTDKNALEVKGSLETLGLKVTIEKKKVEEAEDVKYDPEKIIEQSVKPKKKLDKGDEIILYVPDVIVKYPDFTVGFTKEQIEAWAKQNNVNVIFEEVVKDGYPEGTIYSQERPAGSIVADNVTFKIYVVKAPIITPEKTEEETTNDTNKTDNGNN